jgi:hypothetical protein
MSYKILGQIYPSAPATLDELYVVPALKETVCSTLTMCNQGTAADTVRVAVNVAGAAAATKAYIYYDLAIPAKETFATTIGIALATTDQIEVYSLLGTTSFNLFGNENDV